tara:strand:- start:42 stop:1838 length:1797 start_codon:yes stop_codon:yes gene_type:complete
MNEEEDIRGGATDEQINQAYKERLILDQQDPRTTEKFLKERAEKKKEEEAKKKEEKSLEPKTPIEETDFGANVRTGLFQAAESGSLIPILTSKFGPAGGKAGSIITVGANIFDIFFSPDKDGNYKIDPKIQDALPFISSVILDDKKFLPEDKTKGVLREGDETNFLSRVFSTGRGGEIDKGIVEFLDNIIRPTTKRRRRTRRSKISPGQLYIDFSYSNLNEQIEKEPLLTDADLTDAERIQYGQMNAESAISLEDYLAQFGASTISRKAIRTYMLEPFKTKYGATDAQVNEYVKLANRNTRDIEATIKYLNYEYKLSQPTVNIDDIAAEMSLLFGQNITPKTIDAIIQGQGGRILYQTDGMKRRNEPAIEITDRESLLNAYLGRLNLLNTHGAFDKGHVYAAAQILRDNKVSNASMFRNLEPEIRASILQLVSPIEVEQLIKGQLTKGKDYIDVIIGNRSKQAGGDPADKVFERLYGNAYGLEEDFKNFLFPNQNLANMIHPDLKPLFGRKYTNLVKKKIKEFEGTGAGPKLQVGYHTLNIIRLNAMKEVLEDYVAGTEITEEEKKAQESMAKVQAFLDFVTQKDMVNKKGEAKRGDE